MLSKFFHCQWYEGSKDDWTTQVRLDLAELGLPEKLEIMKNMSSLSWKNLVKRKSKEYEFKKLVELKESQNKSKLKNLCYEKLEMQQYLNDLEVKTAKNLFRYRVHMANFSGNFKGQGPTKSCILCGNHSDLQELSFSCPVILQNIKITGKYQNIFHTAISTTLAKNLLEITELRSKEQAVPARVPIVHHLVTPTDGCCKPSHNHVV